MAWPTRLEWPPCMFAGMCVRTYACMQVRMTMHMSVCMYVCTHVRMHVCMYVCIARMYVRVHVFIKRLRPNHRAWAERTWSPGRSFLEPCQAVLRSKLGVWEVQKVLPRLQIQLPRPGGLGVASWIGSQRAWEGIWKGLNHRMLFQK